jgi:hypothetical protein
MFINSTCVHFVIGFRPLSLHVKNKNLIIIIIIIIKGKCLNRLHCYTNL